MLPFKRRFVGTKLNRICCLNKHIFFDLLTASSSSALSAQSNLEAEVELAPRSPNSCVLQLSITRSSHELTVNPNAIIDLTGGEVRTLSPRPSILWPEKSRDGRSAHHISTVESKADLAFKENQNFLKYWVEPDR